MLIDRTTGVGQAILQNVGEARVGIVIHADHFSENNTNDDYILWNNYYEYSFDMHKHIDFYVVSTDEQNQLLREQFQKYTGATPAVYTIPVGSLDELKYPAADRTPYSILTASRLAAEKHIDWLIEAVVKARKTVPQLSLDIYGKGGEEARLRELIKKYEAEDYIRLRGQQNMKEIYQDYALYLSASTSEGFGLTLMEAVGGGLPIIGFDVRYGKLAAAGDDGVTIGIAQSDPQKGNKTSWNTPAPAPKGEDDQPTYNLKIVDGQLVVTSELPNIGVRLYSAKESPKGPSDFKGSYATKGHLTGVKTASFNIPKGDTFKLFLHVEDTSYETNAVIGCEVSMIGQGMQNVGKDVTVEVSRVVENDIALVGTYSLLDFATLEGLEADTYTVTLIYNDEALVTMECVVTAGQTATADFGYVTVVGEKEIVCPYVDNLGGLDHGIFPDYPLYEAMPIAD